MPTHEINKILNATFCTSDGEEIAIIPTAIQSIDMTADNSDYLDLKPFQTKEFNGSFNVSYVDSKLIDELTGRNKKAKVVGRKLVQSRIHKKKRINKKWAKKYGYDLVLYMDWE